jgi:hypothetical protein
MSQQRKRGSCLRKKGIKRIKMEMHLIRAIVTNINHMSSSHSLHLVDRFKTHRRILFAIGKAIKYTLWLSFAIFWYHIYLLKKTPKPE